MRVETDHRPIITLFKKPLAEIPTRLQRLMLRIQAYDLMVEYKPGTQMYIADSLSRSALQDTSENELDEDIKVHVNLMIKSMPISAERTQWLVDATIQDEAMQLLKQYFMEGWPEKRTDVNPIVSSSNVL